MPVWFQLIPSLVRFYELKNWIRLTLCLSMKKNGSGGLDQVEIGCMRSKKDNQIKVVGNKA